MGLWLLVQVVLRMWSRGMGGSVMSSWIEDDVLMVIGSLVNSSKCDGDNYVISRDDLNYALVKLQKLVCGLTSDAANKMVSAANQ
jgi:hypothetical protein